MGDRSPFRWSWQLGKRREWKLFSIIINYQVQGQHHLAGVVSWGFGCALVSFVTPFFVKNFFSKNRCFLGEKILYLYKLLLWVKTSNLEGVKGGKLFSERGQHSFTDTNTLWLPMFLPQSCQYKFVKISCLSLSCILQEGLPGVYSSVSYHR